MATKLIPSRATAEPPSGTEVELFAEKLKLILGPPPAFWTVKAQLAVVSSKPGPVMVPVPLMSRNVPFCVTTVELRRLNVNPPTLQRVGSPPGGGRNVHGVIVAGVPFAMLEKSPLTN